MLNYYQPFLLPFLRARRYVVNTEVDRRFYISFEDALWNVLHSLQIPKGSTILVPNFYCMDVIENIHNHGYSTKYYKLDYHFQISKRNLNAAIKKHSPSVIVLFHACGISNTLLKNRIYLRSLVKRMLVIEDAVHTLLNPERVSVIHDNHIIIDSLRKVTPLNGSYLYGTKKTIARIVSQATRESLYVLATHILFTIFKIIFQIGVLLNSQTITVFSHSLVLKIHDDLIGDSQVGHPGHPLVSAVHRFLDFHRIESIKNIQCLLYEKYLNPIYINPKNYFYKIHICSEDYKKLHVYPIGIKLSKNISHALINEKLAIDGYSIWTKFPDCPWSKNRAVLFLPLGFHVRYNEIMKLATRLGTLI